jgi:hypothetical protein
MTQTNLNSIVLLSMDVKQSSKEHTMLSTEHAIVHKEHAIVYKEPTMLPERLHSASRSGQGVVMGWS